MLFGRYDLVASLGHGGMADVYLAVLRGPSGFNKLLVLKSMRAALGEDDRFRNMFLDEARLAARLQHPNIVQTLEVGEIGGNAYIVMEYLDGQPLNMVLAASRKGQALSAPMMTYIVRELLSGLQYAHELADYDGKPLLIVHRDISPHNIFVTYEGEIKLVDFGVAKAATNMSRTEAGGVKGKLAYMSPEQARGETIDRRTDLFAVGIVLWEMLARRRLFASDAPSDTVRAVLSGAIPSFEEVGAQAPDGLAAAVSRALARSPDERFATAEAFRVALHPFAAGADRGDLAAWMKTTFEAERAERKKQIGQALRPPETVDDAQTLTSHTPPVGLLPEIGASAIASSSSGGVGISAAPTKGTSALSSTVTPADGTRSPPGSRHSTWLVRFALVAGATAALAVALRLHGRQDERPASSGGPASATAATAASVTGEVALRLRGSETIGSVLAPALMEAFLKDRGATTSVIAGTNGVTQVVGTLKDHPKPQIAEISKEGSATAFTSLAAHECDVGMSSRPITDEEAAASRRAGLGDLTSSASEHVIGLDSVAVIVYPNNRVRSISFEQMTSIFNGETTDWSALGEESRPIALYLLDDNSGTFGVLKTTLGGRPSASAKRFVKNEELADAVAADPDGLGFVAASSVRRARAVPVLTPEGMAVYATPFTMVTESYPLTRRLYLYTPEGSTNALAADFVRFATSSDGQKVVRAAGFVDLNIIVQDWDPCAATTCPGRYAGVVKRARRLSVDFRFRSGTVELDGREADVDRLVTFLRDNPGRIALMGFSDVGVDREARIQDSIACAKSVRDELRSRGVEPAAVDGFGEALPIAARSDARHAVRNRRVEVWRLDDGSNNGSARDALHGSK